MMENFIDHIFDPVFSGDYRGFHIEVYCAPLSQFYYIFKQSTEDAPTTKGVGFPTVSTAVMAAMSRIQSCTDYEPKVLFRSGSYVECSTESGDRKYFKVVDASFAGCNAGRVQGRYIGDDSIKWYDVASLRDPVPVRLYRDDELCKFVGSTFVRMFPATREERQSDSLEAVAFLKDRGALVLKNTETNNGEVYTSEQLAEKFYFKHPECGNIYFFARFH